VEAGHDQNVSGRAREHENKKTAIVERSVSSEKEKR
jgi:hypothetical protein